MNKYIDKYGKEDNDYFNRRRFTQRVQEILYRKRTDILRENRGVNEI